VTSRKFTEVLQAAAAGESDAIEAILWLFMPLINKHSLIDNRFDEDKRQYIIMRAIPQFAKF